MIKNLIEKCRSIRRYDPEAYPTHEELRAFVDCARLCASAANLQRLRFSLVEGERAAEMYSYIGLGGYLPPEEKPTYSQRPGAYIVIMIPTDAKDANISIDVGIASEAIALAATEAGYGYCMIRNFKAEGVCALVGAEGYIPGLVISLGVSVERSDICEIPEDGSIRYYHGDMGVNKVPKRALDEVIL